MASHPIKRTLPALMDNRTSGAGNRHTSVPFLRQAIPDWYWQPNRQ